MSGQIQRVLIGAVLAFAIVIPSTSQATEVLRTMWRGQWVNYVERGDYAVVEGHHHRRQRPRSRCNA